jgi:hypothetical protein
MTEIESTIGNTVLPWRDILKDVTENEYRMRAMLPVRRVMDVMRVTL